VHQTQEGVEDVKRLNKRGRNSVRASKPLADMRVVILGGNNAACGRLFKFLADGPRVREVIFIGHPFARDLLRRSQLMVCRDGRVREWVIKRGQHYGFISYLGDICITLFLLLFLKRRYDLYFSGVPHLALLGLLLGALRIAERTVYWTHDYHPKRFRNGILNDLYLKLDEICATRSAYTWNVVPQITEDRRQRGVRVSPDRVLVVGDPLRAEQIDWLPLEEVPPASIINSGLVEGYGFDLLLETLPLVIAKQPKTRITVTTYQEFPQSLRARMRELGLESRFDLLGYVAARGVVVIITRVAPIAVEIEREGAGIVIDYDKEQLAGAILRILSDDKFYRRCRENAINLAQQYRADRIFPSSLRRMGVEV
jgi:glycosyltransferase involved in cell wall biosynthesis